MQVYLMKQILAIHLDKHDEEFTVRFLGQQVGVLRRGCGGSVERARELIAAYDGKVDAIGLQGMPARLQLGPAHAEHVYAAQLCDLATETPVVDGSGIRAGVERWGVILADRAQPGIFSAKRVLMVPGLNHNGLIQALERRASAVRYADPYIYFGWPRMPGVGSGAMLNRAARFEVDQLSTAPFRRIYPVSGEAGRQRASVPFLWADVIAGDIGAVRRYAPKKLKRKTVIVNHADEQDLADLRDRGVDILITMMPSLDGDDLGRWPSSVVEAALVALRTDPDAPLTEDTYLDLMADIQWSPAVRYLQPNEAKVNRFAFVIHPLNISFIHKHPLFGFTRYLPDRLVEEVAAYMPPMYVSRITGGQSPTTGQQIEGHLITLAATPRMMLKHDEHFTYKRLNRAARMAERKGARLMGLGAFTSVVGDAGITVAHEADIAITSGNSLTVAATLEAAKMAVKMMGATDLTKGKVMIVGATGSIASVCSRLLAQAIHDVVLVSIEPEKLIELKRTIQKETPDAKVTIATRTGELVGECDLIVTATSAFGQRVIDLTKCKPGAVICDVARPMDINPAEAALRPDLLVIESGEVLIPGDINFGYNIGLPPKTAYACLGETALLAMDGRFEDFTLGRNIDMERVKEIWRLFKKHRFQIAGLRSFGEYITEEDVAQRRALAEVLRNDPERLARAKADAAEKLKVIPVMAKGVKASGSSSSGLWMGLAAGVAALAMLGLGFKRAASSR
jgi:predicted amino acid dehydrogenase